MTGTRKTGTRNRSIKVQNRRGTPPNLSPESGLLVWKWNRRAYPILLSLKGPKRVGSAFSRPIGGAPSDREKQKCRRPQVCRPPRCPRSMTEMI
ncbi:hypothetical protein FQN60_016057 [Etheostoma spectabile]|uniref:Uncharacterized protein n=1 Tax=Etheostoma spectabile TaxID=54343 RepID=A0A5J5CCD4_9PERO|nr:hypothetical protein FQN60_016056 [Etheostoma spectabile]KAA8577640.1 hypothetical protein FQN60_016057 [Etheostoma spectabile]